MNIYHDETMEALETISEAIDHYEEVKTTLAIMRERVCELEHLCDSLRSENADLKRELLRVGEKY
jgi:hypothetical protein